MLYSLLRVDWTMVLILILLSCITCVSGDFGTKNANNYGPYEVEWVHYDACRGPKSVNLTKYTTALFKDERNYYTAIANMTFLEQARIDEIKMYVYTIKDTGKTLLWNYYINKPCQHYVLAALFESELGVKNCVAKKGDYYCVFNLTELMINYIGKSFFYGDYWFKVLVMSKKGNIMCLIFDPSFKKIK